MEQYTLEQLIENIGYSSAQLEKWNTTKQLSEWAAKKSGECFAKMEDIQAKTYREISQELSILAKKERKVYDEQYKEKHQQYWEEIVKRFPNEFVY